MKILHITASYKPAWIYGGPVMSVGVLCEQLVKAGIGIEVFTTTANGKHELPVTPNVPTDVDGVKVTYFRRITKDHTHFSPLLLKTLRARVKDFDAVHIHAWWNLVVVLAAFTAIKKGVPVILSPRGTLSVYSFLNRNSLKKKLIHTALGKKLLHKCHIHATAQSEARATQEVVKPLSISVIPNFVKLPVTIPASVDYGRGSTVKLLFFSRIEEKKGLDILLQGLPPLKFPFTLTIAGTGEPEYIDYLKTLVPDAEIMSKITWAGFVTDEKFHVLSNHHLMVLPSHDENFGNVVIESLSVGTPVLISNKVGLADYVAEKNLGWVCETEKADLAEKLNHINDTFSEEFKRIKNAAPQIIRDDFDTAKLVDQYISLYEKVAAKRSPAHHNKN